MYQDTGHQHVAEPLPEVQLEPGFDSKQWQYLWHRRVRSIASMQVHAVGCAFVVIDALGTTNAPDCIATIGVTCVLPRHLQQTNLQSESLLEVCRSTKTHTYYITIEDYYTVPIADEFNRVALANYGQIHRVNLRDLPNLLVDIMTRFQFEVNRYFASSGGGWGKLVLVGYGMLYHLQRTLACHGELPEQFWTCVDLREVLRLSSDSAPRNDKDMPALRDALFSVGYPPRGDLLKGANDGQNAGNGSIRITALLARLMQQQPGAALILRETPDRPRPPRMNYDPCRVDISKMNYFYNKQPTPIASFPFVAKLYLHRPLFRYTEKSPAEYHYIYQNYHPTAIGTLEREPGIWGAYMCFATREELDLFEDLINRLGYSECRGTWKATSLYDPVLHAQYAAKLDEGKMRWERAMDRQALMNAIQHAGSELEQARKAPPRDFLSELESSTYGFQFGAHTRAPPRG